MAVQLSGFVSDVPTRRTPPARTGEGKKGRPSEFRRSRCSRFTAQFVGVSTIRAGTLSEITDCWIENETPSVSLGAAARYVVQLFGGNGSYSISLAYGDGWMDGASVSGSQATFAHRFQTTGTFTHTDYEIRRLIGLLLGADGGVVKRDQVDEGEGVAPVPRLWLSAANA